jgi:hypothetical protein
MANVNDGESHDVFISYKRRTASAEARLIRSDLAQRGLRVFMDVTDLGGGLFDESLRERIAHTPNFIVVLAPHAMDRCADEGDWLRIEVSQAIATKRNIVPVILPGFRFPKELPEELSALPRYQSVEYSHIFYDAMMTRLLEMLDKPAHFRDKPPRKEGSLAENAKAFADRRWWIATGTFVFLAAVIALVMAYEQHAAKNKILAEATALRQDFANAAKTPPDSRQLYVTAVENDIDAILKLDPRNGTGFYYAGELKRLNNPELFTEKRCLIPAALKSQPGPLDQYEDDFYRYLDIEKSLPASQTGGGSSAELCYSRAPGYCPQRTAWIEHLLANDLYQEGLMAADRGVQTEMLGRALKFAQDAAQLYQDPNHNPGFSQCMDTESLIRAIQSNLGPSGK